jgi:hypothetical protein
MDDDRGLIFIEGLSQPARRALAGAGFSKLEHLAGVGEKDLANLHGMGPKGLRVLRDALNQNGLAFKKASNRTEG